MGQNGHLEDPAFVNYLEYLLYWKQPTYAKFITYDRSPTYLRCDGRDTNDQLCV